MALPSPPLFTTTKRDDTTLRAHDSATSRRRDQTTTRPNEYRGMTFIPAQVSHLFLLSVAALIFHAMLWARNGRFLWRNRRIILAVVAICELWTLITDPIGGHWRAWLFDPDKVLGVWLFGVTPLENFFGMAVVSSAAACAILVFGYSKRRWI